MYKLINPSAIAIDMGFTEPNTVLRLADNAFIPINPANTDYQEYLKWIAEGNTPLPAEE
jgi:hypothetical protein